MSWASPRLTCQHVAMTDGTELAEGERTVLLLHPHWKILLRPALILLLVAVAAAVVLLMIPPGSYAGPGRIVVGVLAVVAAVTWFGVPFLRWQTTTYEVTTRRVRLRRGILSRSGRDFPLARVSDISFEQGPIDRLLGCGQLIVESAGEHGQLVLTEIPQVKKVQSILFQLVEDEHGRLAREDSGT